MSIKVRRYLSHINLALAAARKVESTIGNWHRVEEIVTEIDGVWRAREKRCDKISWAAIYYADQYAYSNRQTCRNRKRFDVNFRTALPMQFFGINRWYHMVITTQDALGSLMRYPSLSVSGLCLTQSHSSAYSVQLLRQLVVVDSVVREKRIIKSTEERLCSVQEISSFRSSAFPFIVFRSWCSIIVLLIILPSTYQFYTCHQTF